MDESFSDFQEKKKCNTGPKNTQKAKAKSIKRKPLKKTQKDIRVFVKSKENELVSYTKNFSEICKKSGLDVDSGQLELAIALSKSLLQSGSSTDGHNSQEEKHLSSQERTAKIKLTLQEYGFKVPNTKININKRKRLKKQYKLLLLSEQEKKQIITNKYLKILETNFYKSLEEDIQCNYKQSELFYIATNIPFENTKNNEVFYVKDLGLDISHSISLLRDWSQIPGRPLSPIIEVNNFKFTDTKLKQEELDLILTGNLGNIKYIIKNKNTEQIKLTETIMCAEKIEFCIDDDVEVANVIKKSNSSSSSISEDILDTNRLSTTQSMVSVQRSVSPDIFDDDITILEYTTSAKTIEATNDKKGNQTCFMDLTECVAITNIQPFNSKINNENNITKRKSNDYMDITECVTSSKQMSVEIENIDLTQQFVPFNKSKNNKNSNNKKTSNKDDIQTMDLTQSSNSEVETEIVEHKEIENDSSDDTIIINDNNDERNIIRLCDKKIASDNNTIKDQSVSICIEFQNNNSVLSATESSETVSKATKDAIPTEENICSPTYTYTDHVFEHSYIYDYDNFDDNQEVGISDSSDEGNIVKMSTEGFSSRCNIIGMENSNLHKKSSCTNINETSVNHEKIIIENCKISTNNENDLSVSSKEIHEHLQLSKRDTGKNETCSIAKENNTEEIDTGNINITDINTNETNHITPPEDYNDYVFEHSYIYDYDGRNSPNIKDNDDNNKEIDLTQTSDEESTKIKGKNSLGKIDNISIDYDDVIVVENVNSISKSSSLVHDEEASNCSKRSEIFEVSDKEFNYSLHQSRFDNYDADGFDDIQKTAKKPRTLNRSMSENDIYITDNKIGDGQKIKSDHLSHSTTPVKALSQDVKSAVIQTPNNDYIIKTRDVTPMADYSSMSSPERNEELKRYGLKPFKRKRAIQLLTYLYNQTHPVVESYEETSSTAKRLKYDTPKQKSPRKSPKKALITKSPLKSCNVENIEEMNSLLYIQTKDLPDIKEIHCDPEDWVFQTREKSKVHSCRVPIHIAFHNYVTCRKYLRESILRYEPVNIDIIHKELVSIGYRYNPKDLLKFMDKKCITVKTTDNNARNRR